jgi:ethanolamine utilization protein EutP (predicted NTPase)
MIRAKMPSGVDTTLPSKIKVAPPWDRLKTAVPYSALPLQEAVNFVAYLIMMQAGKARFAPGVATVGGRTHVGVITKDDPYRQLNEPELTHHYTGFADDH